MGHKHQLCDLLIMPVQRITRYPLLLKEVYKYTEQANLIAEVEALQQARQTMEDIAKAANDIMDISRLQGFDVSNLFFTSILTLWGRITIRSCPRRAGPATYSQAWLEFIIRIRCFICKPEQIRCHNCCFVSKSVYTRVLFVLSCRKQCNKLSSWHLNTNSLHN